MKFKSPMDDKSFPQDKIRRITQKAKQITTGSVSPSDPDGSYTGVPKNPYEKPVQDADDL